MTHFRKGNDKYVLGYDALGRRSWRLRHDAPMKSFRDGDDMMRALVEAASENSLGFDERFVSLPQPSGGLLEQIRARNGNLSGLDLSGLDLRGVFAESQTFDLTDTNLSGSDLRGVCLFGAQGYGVNFTGARTAGMYIGKGVILGDVISGGEFDMSGMRVGESSIMFAERTKLVGLEDVTASHYGGYGVSVTFGNVDFSDSVVSSDALRVFSELRNSSFKNFTFSSSDVKGESLFRGTRFAKCDFSDSVIPDVGVSWGYFDRCKFDGADMSGWSFDGGTYFLACSFRDANLSGWEIERASGVCELSFQGRGEWDGVNLCGVDERILREMKRSGFTYEKLSVAEAAGRCGVGVDEFGVLVWLGEVEVRDSKTDAVADGGVGGRVYVPSWVADNFGK